MAKLKSFQDRLKDNDFPEPAPWKTPEECQEAYESGFPGAYLDPEGVAEWEANIAAFGEPVEWSDVAQQYALDDIGAATDVVLLYEEAYAASGHDDWIRGNPPQQVGDCVSHSIRNCLMLSLAAQVNSGRGGGWPNIPKHVLESMTGFTTVPLYNLRSNANGHGWSCGTSIKEATNRIGMVVADKYEIDGKTYNYSTYSGNQTTQFGKSGPPASYIGHFGGHKIQASARVSGWNQIRDALASGFAVHSCGSEGFDSQRDEWCRARKKGSWQHALCYAGYRADKATMDTFGEPLVLILNSWGKSSCKGNRNPKGLNTTIPHNGWFAKWSEIKNRDCYAISAVAGWPPAKLQQSWKKALKGLI